MVFDPLPMIYWPLSHGVLNPLLMVCWTPYQWHIEPPSYKHPIHGILIPYPWYIEPPVWNFDSLPMVYRTACLWYIELIFDPLANHGKLNHLTMVFRPLRMVYWTLWPSTNGISTPQPMVFYQLPIVYWPHTHCVFWPLTNEMLYPSLWYFDPLPFDIPMVYWISCLWYFVPHTRGIWSPAYGILTPIHVIYQTPAYGILTPLPMVYRTQAYDILNPLTMVYWTSCL